MLQNVASKGQKAYPHCGPIPNLSLTLHLLLNRFVVLIIQQMQERQYVEDPIYAYGKRRCVVGYEKRA
jgi:hypothetical protein